MKISLELSATPAPHTVNASQRGMALVFALVVLLILTILGVSGLRTSSIEQLMSGNVQEQTRAFEAADSGLSRALNDMKNNTATVDPTQYTSTPYTYSVTTSNGSEKTSATATAATPTLTQIGPSVRSNNPSGSNTCTAYYDQNVVGATSGTFAQERLHQGLAVGAPCPQSP